MFVIVATVAVDVIHLLEFLVHCLKTWLVVVSLVSSSSYSSPYSSSSSSLTSHIERNQMKILCKHLPFFVCVCVCVMCSDEMSKYPRAVYFCGKNRYYI